MGHLAPASLLGRARQRGHRAAKVRSRRSSRNSCTKEFWVWLLILVFAWAVFRVWDNHEGTCTLLSKSLFSSQQSHDQELQHVCHRPRAFIQYTGLTTWFSLGEGGGQGGPFNGILVPLHTFPAEQLASGVHFSAFLGCSLLSLAGDTWFTWQLVVIKCHRTRVTAA